MTKQEKIREELERMQFMPDDFEVFEGSQTWSIRPSGVKKILNNLHSQGVVIIDRDKIINLGNEGFMASALPDIFDGSLSMSQYYNEKKKYLAIAKLIEEELKGAGYVATISLIEVK